MVDWLDDALTKHEQIIRYIEGLRVGSKISVRQIAKHMEVSEGTAYRAIKEAENQGIVSTKERIGTVRIEKKQRNNIENLTFAEVVNIVNGRVLGGSDGLYKTLNKFVIGAMERDAMMQYIKAGSLLIVGNRLEAHVCALESGAGVLITGGFDTGEEVKELANSLNLPIISCSDDTFTVASMINRAIYDTLIRKKIMFVEDIVSLGQKIHALKANATVREWKRRLEETGHSRFPVVDEWNRVIGIVTAKDVVGAHEDQTLDKLMTRSPQTVTLRTSITAAAHMMVWEGIDFMPVIDQNRKLIGVIGRPDVLQAMQFIQRQPQIGETFEDLIWSGFAEKRDDNGSLYFSGTVTPQMTSNLGTVSEGVLTTLLTQSAIRVLKEYKKGDLVLENMSTYFIRPVQIESEVEIRPRIIEVSRRYGKVDVEIVHNGHPVAKAMINAQVIDQL
jgi:predicted transcriptional regulator